MSGNALSYDLELPIPHSHDHEGTYNVGIFTVNGESVYVLTCMARARNLRASADLPIDPFQRFIRKPWPTLFLGHEVCD